jgi:hypothetical protein
MPLDMAVADHDSKVIDNEFARRHPNVGFDLLLSHFQRSS